MIICKKCHESLVSENSTKAEIYKNLIKVLCDLTCIEWIKAYPNAPTPDGCEMLGMVSIQNADISGTTEKLEVLQKEGSDEKAYCVSVIGSVLYDLELTVIGNAESFCVDGVEHEQPSPEDLLIELAHILSASKDTLGEIQIGQIKNINSGYNRTDGNVWEETASVLTTLNVCRKTAYADDPKIITCVHLCGDEEPLCNEPRKC